MKTFEFVEIYIGLLIMSDYEILAHELTGKHKERNNMVKNTEPHHPVFSHFGLPSLSSFVGMPLLQGLMNPSKQQTMRITKTEYVEVTRRQTVHPMCYTAYEAMPYCLPHGPRQDHQEEEVNDSEFYTAYESDIDNLSLNDIGQKIKSTPAIAIKATASPVSLMDDNVRHPKYLEFKGKIQEKQFSLPMKAPDFLLSLNFPRHHSTEFFTKTVLVNKLEKYTDHEVTATLVAVNCLPVRKSIPMCRPEFSPIKEAPDNLFEDKVDAADTYNSGGMSKTVHYPADTDELSTSNSSLEQIFPGEF